MISFVYAMDRNQVIGHQQWMPWDLPRDLQFFKEKTLHHTIIMGRKTFESFNKALPKRHNVVITSDQSYQPDDCEVIHSIDPVLEWNKLNPEKEYLVIGGGTVFKQFLPYADRMYMTYIDASFSGDTYFPEFDLKDWELISKTKGIKDENNQHDYYFLQYDRKN